MPEWLGTGLQIRGRGFNSRSRLLKATIPDIISTDSPFAVVARPPYPGGRDAGWWVIRARDSRVMTEGAVTTCCKWVHVWGPMHR